jgi:DNA-binding CsgD family transcriptional regulator
MIATALGAARAGRGTALCFDGDAGMGKTTLLDAAVAAAPDFRHLRTVGVEGTTALGHAGLADVVTPLLDLLPAVPEPQRRALDAALGLAGPAEGSRYLVAAGLLSLLSAAAADRPVLLVVDDLQWVDRESRAALLFAVRRLRHDPVAALLACRDSDVDPDVPTHRLAGLAPEPARALLRGLVAAPVADRLVAETGGNPLGLTETARSLTPGQRRGSAALPGVLPVGDRLASALRRSVAGLTPPARRALVLAAAHTGAATVVAALAAEGLDPERAVDEAERAGALVVRDGSLLFRHPLLRAVVWADAAPAERRSAHGSLAARLHDRPEQRVRHLAEAVLGHDDELARALLDAAAQERRRSGHAAAGALAERAAQLTSSPVEAAARRAAAVEDAFLGGDGERVRRLAADVLDGPADDGARSRALLWLGVLEQYAGSVHRARDLLERAAATGSGPVALRAVAELASVGYRTGQPEAMASAARSAAGLADASDPEQEMLARYTEAAALAVAGRWEQAHAPAARALELLETDPVLRDEPRHLALALLAAGWMREPLRAAGFLDRRMDRARALGALGVLPLPLSLVAGGAALLGRHDLAHAWAGEAVELGTELGYAADVAIAHEVAAWQAAARGLPDEAAASLAEARRLAAVAGTDAAAVHVDLVDAFAALCRGDLPHVVAVLERRLRIDDGRLPRGDYPLSVAPDLVEAYLGTGRAADAAALAARHAKRHRDTPDPDIAAHRARLLAMTCDDGAAADAGFAEAHRAHAGGRDPFEAGRTRLLHGSRLRRDGQRVAAREQLRTAGDAFRAMDLSGWAARADDELAATGRTARRGRGAGDQLTSQETRVVVLVARGMTNREIAAALFLSPRTVEHHITSALRKRGMRSRTELAIAQTAGEQ